jgi:hypothetical protein
MMVNPAASKLVYSAAAIRARLPATIAAVGRLASGSTNSTMTAEPLNQY